MMQYALSRGKNSYTGRAGCICSSAMRTHSVNNPGAMGCLGGWYWPNDGVRGRRELGDSIHYSGMHASLREAGSSPPLAPQAITMVFFFLVTTLGLSLFIVRCDLLRGIIMPDRMDGTNTSP